MGVWDASGLPHAMPTPDLAPLLVGHAPHRPRTLPVPGFHNVLLLRDPTQANAIATSAEGKRVVVIGTSFIGEHYIEGVQAILVYTCILYF